MRRALTAIWNNDGHFLMGALTLTTAAIGGILANADVATFATGPGWYYFSRLALGPIHPSEEQWGIMFLALALLQWVSIWQLANLNYHVQIGVLTDRADFTPHRLGRVVWGATGSIYAGIAVSFLFSNPWGTGTILWLLPACLAWRVMVNVRHDTERAGKAGESVDA